jgi:hypothetical protein
VSFEPRLYPDIVRDLLTVLTGGTVAETYRVGPDGVDSFKLDHAPVARVSHLEGQILLGDQPTPYRFTERDFQLVGTDDRPTELSTVKFRDGGKRPAPNTTLTVNYYPSRRNKLTPVNDVNVGSVVRTVLETVSFELATQYQQLKRVYDSGFIDSAQGGSLDRVSALVDVQRLQAGHPIGKVRFARRPNSLDSDIFIPANTAVSDGKGARYLTSQDGQMLPNQSSIELWVQGETLRTKTVGARALTVLERAVAGVDSVVNDDATFRASEAERDDQLAGRAKRAIHGTGRGTLDAIQFAVQNLPFVSSVTLTERPDGVPGTLRVAVALTDDNAFKRAQVEQAVLDYRPAGILATVVYAGKSELGFHLQLTLAGASLPTSTVTAITDGVKQRLGALAGDLKPGDVLRRARVTSAVLDDKRILDAAISYTVDNNPVTQDGFQLDAHNACHLDPAAVVFDQVRFEKQAAAPGPRLVQVDAELTVVLIDNTVTDASALVPAVQARLKPFLEGLAAGASLDFDHVLTALRGDPAYVVTPGKSTLALVEDSGAFTELRDGDPAYTLASGAAFKLRNVNLTQDSG